MCVCVFVLGVFYNFKNGSRSNLTSLLDNLTLLRLNSETPPKDPRFFFVRRSMVSNCPCFDFGNVFVCVCVFLVFSELPLLPPHPCLSRMRPKITIRIPAKTLLVLSQLL